MSHPPNAFDLLRPRATPLPPDQQAKPHPRKRGAEPPGSPPTRQPETMRPRR